MSKAVSREKLEMFEELARIFSEDNNAVAQRELLVRSEPTQIVKSLDEIAKKNYVWRCREGTAKFADTAGEKDHHLQKVLQKHVENSRAIR